MVEMSCFDAMGKITSVFNSCKTINQVDFARKWSMMLCDYYDVGKYPIEYRIEQMYLRTKSRISGEI